jgi:hypothetical protein
MSALVGWQRWSKACPREGGGNPVSGFPELTKTKALGYNQKSIDKIFGTL